jgi:hypothetical protein
MTVSLVIGSGKYSREIRLIPGLYYNNKHKLREEELSKL